MRCAEQRLEVPFFIRCGNNRRKERRTNGGFSEFTNKRPTGRIVFFNHVQAFVVGV
jgi:hypothetical protein